MPNRRVVSGTPERLGDMGHRHLRAVKEEGLVGASSRQSGGEKRETLLGSSTTKRRSEKEQELEEQVG